MTVFEGVLGRSITRDQPSLNDPLEEVALALGERLGLVH